MGLVAAVILLQAITPAASAAFDGLHGTSRVDAVPDTLRLAGAVTDVDPVLAPPSILRIVVEPQGSAEIVGIATAGARIRVSNSGKPLGSTIAGPDGKWTVVLSGGLAPGEHLLTAVVVTAAGTEGIVSQDVRIAIPADLKGERVLAYDGPSKADAPAGKPSGDAAPAVSGTTSSKDDRRSAAEKLENGASQAFGTIVGQKPPETSAAPSAATPSGPPPTDERSLGQRIRDAVVAWIETSSDAYDQDIVPELSVPSSTDETQETGSAAEFATKPASGREDDEVEIAMTPPPGVPPEINEVARRKIAEAQRALEEAAEERRRLAESSLDSQTPKTDPAEDARRRAEIDRQKAEELARRKADKDREIARQLQELEAAKAAAEARKAKEIEERRNRDKSGSKSGTPAKLAALPDAKDSVPGDRGGQASSLARVEATPAFIRTRKRTAVESSSSEQRERADEVAVLAPSSGLSRATSKVNKSRESAVPRSRCAEGRVVRRKGKRWYIAGEDDTLWDIAERFYGKGTRYTLIYKANRNRMSDPDVVRPCLRLRLPRTALDLVELSALG